MAKCCPRLKVVCRRLGAMTVAQSYWTQKTPLSKPRHHTVKARIPARVKCFVRLGKRQVSPLFNVDSPGLDRAVKKYQNALSQQGCSDTSPSWGNVPNVKSPRYGDGPSEATDLLRAKVKRLLRK